jgi:predicted phosphodiesterase
MDNNSFAKLITNSSRIVNNPKFRPKDSNGKPGSLVVIPQNLSAIIVGDLHGAVGNLKAIVNHENNLEKLKNNKAMLIIVGDALHNDQTGQMMEMQSSYDSLIYLLTLINELPDNIIYIRGNHDTFDDRLRKSGISQGLEFRKFLSKNSDENCINEIEKFFEILPMFVIGQGYAVTHAGPVRRGITREELINIKNDVNGYMQLMWNRIHEFRGNPSLKEYGEDDIKSMIEKLNLPADTQFIVGHNPLWNTGELSGIWMNVLGIKNHHIIYSNLQTLAPYFIYENNELKKKFAVQPKKEAYYV